MYIIFDLDETLLNYKREVDDFTLCTLRYFQNKGHHLVINTARSLINTKKLIDIIKPDYSILYGGSLIVDKNLNILFESAIDQKVLNSLVQDIYDYAKVISVETIDDIYSSEQSEKYKYFPFKEKKFTEKVYKFLFCMINDEVKNNLALKYNLNVVTYANLIWHRYVNKDVSKFLGITHLLKITGGTLADCIAFGDDYGDVEMINKCGEGVLMENASEEVKKMCFKKQCLDNNNFGVARFLLNYFKED
ncbi:MAG: HAD-IIB family hydrolase [Bacilli bacterium]|nr:HAD-IIB family hydrolase [Bacilli bacterium]